MGDVYPHNKVGQVSSIHDVIYKLVNGIIEETLKD